jgi:hypothetical protein
MSVRRASVSAPVIVAAPRCTACSGRAAVLREGKADSARVSARQYIVFQQH